MSKYVLDPITNTVESDDFPLAPSIEEIKRTCIWLAVTGWNDHWFFGNVRQVADILHYSALYDESDALYQIMGRESEWSVLTFEQKKASLFSVLAILESIEVEGFDVIAV